MRGCFMKQLGGRLAGAATSGMLPLAACGAATNPTDGRRPRGNPKDRRVAEDHRSHR